MKTKIFFVICLLALMVSCMTFSDEKAPQKLDTSVSGANVILRVYPTYPTMGDLYIQTTVFTNEPSSNTLFAQSNLVIGIDMSSALGVYPYRVENLSFEILIAKMEAGMPNTNKIARISINKPILKFDYYRAIIGNVEGVTFSNMNVVFVYTNAKVGDAFLFEVIGDDTINPPLFGDNMVIIKP